MTRKLSTILISLIFLLILYVFITKFDFISSTIENFLYSLNKEKIIIEEPNNYERDYKYQTFSMTDDFEPDSITDIKNIFYTILNNGWNNFTFYCSSEYENCSEDVKEVANDEEFISLLNNYVNPFNSFINFNTLITGDKVVYITIDKLYNEIDITDTNNKLDEIFSSLNINKNNYNKSDIKRLHDYLIAHTIYNKNYVEGDYSSPSNKATGALLEGEAVCSGYADAFALILDRLGIRNFKVSSENHIWNVIYIDNSWLHIDSTWDDDENNINNRDNFYMITTKKLYELDTLEHTFDKDNYLELN